MLASTWATAVAHRRMVMPGANSWIWKDARGLDLGIIHSYFTKIISDIVSQWMFEAAAPSNPSTCHWRRGRIVASSLVCRSGGQGLVPHRGGTEKHGSSQSKLRARGRSWIVQQTVILTTSPIECQLLYANIKPVVYL